MTADDGHNQDEVLAAIRRLEVDAEELARKLAECLAPHLQTVIAARQPSGRKRPASAGASLRPGPSPTAFSQQQNIPPTGSNLGGLMGQGRGQAALRRRCAPEEWAEFSGARCFV